MDEVLIECPLCGEVLKIRKVSCGKCGVDFKRDLPVSELEKLPLSQQRFLESYVLCNGKLNRLGKKLNLSYPAIRKRMDDVIRSLGEMITKEKKSKIRVK